MSDGIAMGWRGLSPATRDRLVRDAWLLAAWWVVVGLACSWVLLDVFRLRSPAVRYPLTAVLMYAIGTVAGTRIWLAAFAREARLQPGRFGSEREARADEARFRRRRRMTGRDPLIGLGAIGVAVEVMVWFESGATLFWLTVISISVTAGVCFLIRADRLISDSPSGVLADLAQEFVFGWTTPRGLLPHRSLGEALPVILRQTCGRGLVFLIFSAVAGVTLILLIPGAATLADIFG